MVCGVLHNCDAFIVHPWGPTRVKRSLSLPFLGLLQRKAGCVSGGEDLARSDVAQHAAWLGYTHDFEIKTEGLDVERSALHKGILEAGREKNFLVLT